MKINIFGSTGTIGIKTLNIIKNYYPKYKVNLLCANSNYKLLYKQVKIYRPKYVYLNTISSSNLLRSKLPVDTKILTYKNLIDYLSSSKSNYTLFAISGYKSLNYLDSILLNTENLGFVNKESIVSAGHLIKKNKNFKKTNIYPIDSEHFSIYDFLNNNKSNQSIKSIIITASGGPFLYKSKKSINSVSFKDAIKHPKWKMGYKNSIDSATLVNKCLEVVEAHYLFDIPYSKIKILIHPEAIVHSIIEKDNYVSHMNLFKNDMSIPIINFLNHKKYTFDKQIKKYNFNNYSAFNFYKVNNNIFPIYKFFNKMDKANPSNLIKFNVGNEYAVNLFKNRKIRYPDIYKIIKKAVSLKLYSPLNNIKSIIKYHEDIEQYISSSIKINT